MASVEEQLGAIWNTLSPVVEQQIRLSGVFAPIAAIIRPDGTVEALVLATVSEDAEALKDHLRSLATAGECLATGVATGVTAQVPEAPAPVTGILYEFDNVDGVSQATFLPYAVDASGQIAFGQLHGQGGAHAIFG